MEATDRLRCAGLATGMAVVLAGGATACAATAGTPAVSPRPLVSHAPVAAVTAG